MNRNAQTVGLIETAENLEDELHAGRLPVAQRLARQLVTDLTLFDREQGIVRAIERNGLTAPSVDRALSEFRREKERLTGASREPSRMPSVAMSHWKDTTG